MNRRSYLVGILAAGCFIATSILSRALDTRKGPRELRVQWQA